MAKARGFPLASQALASGQKLGLLWSYTTAVLPYSNFTATLTLRQEAAPADSDPYDNGVRRCDWWPNVSPKQK